jgi:hypothetical protein
MMSMSLLVLPIPTHIEVRPTIGMMPMTRATTANPCSTPELKRWAIFLSILIRLGPCLVVSPMQLSMEAIAVKRPALVLLRDFLLWVVAFLRLVVGLEA